MAQKEIGQYVRLVSSQKLDDRFLTAQVIEPDAEKKEMGQLLILLEITRPWYPISQIGSRIIATLNKSYYAGQSSSDLINFEKALKDTNEMLLKITEQGETDWIGHLNAVVALQVGKELHVTATGEGEAYLFREGKSSHITHGSGDFEQNPIKTFSQLTSGTLLVNDTIILANPKLREFFDLPTLTSIVGDNLPYDIGLTLAKGLKKIHSKNANALVVKILPESLLTSQPNTIYLDQPIDPFFDRIKRLWQKIGQPLVKTTHQATKNQFQKFKKNTSEKYIPATKKTAQLISRKTTEVIKNTWTKTKPVIEDRSKQFQSKIDQMITGVKEQKNSTNISNDPSISIIGTSIFTVHDYQQEKVNSKLNGIKKIFSPIKMLLLKLWYKIIKLIRLLLMPKRRPLLIILTLGLLIIILITSIAVQKSQQVDLKTNQQQEEALKNAKKKLADGKTALVFSDKQQAQILFGEAIKLAEPLLTSPLAESAKSVVTDSQTEFDKLTGTTRLTNLKPVAQGLIINNFAIVAGKGYGVSDQGKINEINIGSGTSDQIANLPNDDIVAKAILKTPQDSLLIATKNQNLYEFKPSNKSVTKFAPADGEKFAPTTALANFGNNYYLLDSDNDQIWKYQMENNNFKVAQKFIPRSQIDLKNSVDLTIDGAIYTIFKDGKVVKISKGEKQDFKLSGIPKPFESLKNPLKISTEVDSSSIFILDSGEHRIIEFDKNGQFNHQYIYPIEFSQIKGLVVEAKARRAFLLNSDKLYEISF